MFGELYSAKFLTDDIPNSHARILKFKIGPALQELSLLLLAVSSKLLVPVAFFFAIAAFM